MDPPCAPNSPFYVGSFISDRSFGVRIRHCLQERKQSSPLPFLQCSNLLFLFSPSSMSIVTIHSVKGYKIQVKCCGSGEEGSTAGSLPFPPSLLSKFGSNPPDLLCSTPPHNCMFKGRENPNERPRCSPQFFAAVL